MAIKIIRKKKPEVATPPSPVAKSPNTERSVPRSVKPLDSHCRGAIATAPNSIVPWYLMASYCYYVHDISILTDDMYDSLAKTMLDRWDDIRHPHKRLITKDDLKAGTLYHLKESDYPLMTRNAAAHLLFSTQRVRITVKLD